MSYDVVVIGSGPGGYVCAFKAAQLGLKTAMIEKRKTFGGTCLNVGCIPSKALLHASEVYAEASHGYDSIGVKIGKPEFDFAKMMEFKQSVIDANTSGVAFLAKKNKVDTFIGTGKIVAQGKVEVTAEDGSVQTVETKNIVIATGSDVAGIPGVEFEFDEKTIISSTGALALTKVPLTMIVVGAGVIGSELGSVYARLGTKVTVVEYLDKALGGMDGEVSRNFQRLMEKQGITYKLGAKVTGVENGFMGATVRYEPVSGGETQSLHGDVVLVATGRKPYTAGLGLEEVGVKLDSRGCVEIDNHWKTTLDGVYAIGDVVKGPMLAHKAEDEGVAVAEILAGQKGHVNFDVIPGVVYTQPEAASVGKTEEELKAAGIEYNVGKFPFTANGRARSIQHTDGFVKILACKKTDRVLGGHILGYGAGEMIHEIAVLMEFGGSSEDLGRTCHAHPTMSEAVREAALATFAKPLHM
ncbi:dihydrolipoyl dehydrogenase [Bartonella sp. HY329]|uniref:dihydrolipoyl dehydrogenase n=1 Tax=unclassified Bartonella TaxID=2645622 RepID=UPI0021C67E06|nr:MULTISPECIES: dihydrolipoyl dehydrogenase [unclassified Bartonella]UXM95050.1 dihydrolipoyl dehydrogenase [Bartonella sp. HY329]UXN09373.1 dihydrolipoyl dehydrogenase [Bartonella sp. HY328]